MKILIRVLVTAAALAVAAWVVPGIRTEQWTLHGTSAVSNDESIAATLVIVAVIFGIANVIWPVIRKIGCVLSILTFTPIAIVVNGALLYLTSYIAYDKLHLPFHITTGLAAIEGALIVTVASELTKRVLDHRDSGRRGSPGGTSSGGSSSTGGEYVEPGYNPGGYDPGGYSPGHHPPGH